MTGTAVGNGINGRVKWKPILLLMAGAISVSIGSGWKLMDLHAQQPHTGAVTRPEFTMVLRELTEIKQELRIIRQEIRDERNSRGK